MTADFFRLLIGNCVGSNGSRRSMKTMTKAYRIVPLFVYIFVVSISFPSDCQTKKEILFSIHE